MRRDCRATPRAPSWPANRDNDVADVVPRDMRKAPTLRRGPFKKSGGDLLSQGGTPKYHRRWWA